MDKRRGRGKGRKDGKEVQVRQPRLPVLRWGEVRAGASKEWNGMQTVICARCDKCGRLATKDLEWKKNGDSETMICRCGNNQWQFVEQSTNFVTPDVLIISVQQ